MMDSENRKFSMMQTRIAQRRAVGLSGLYKVLDRDKFYARNYMGAKNPMVIIDISTTGCAFKVNTVIPKGSYIEVEINRLSDEHIFNPAVKVACEAVYCQYSDRSSNRVGAKFLEAHPDDISRIRTFTE